MKPEWGFLADQKPQVFLDQRIEKLVAFSPPAIFIPCPFPSLFSRMGFLQKTLSSFEKGYSYLNWVNKSNTRVTKRLR
jgi:hypothetical protein